MSGKTAPVRGQQTAGEPRRKWHVLVNGGKWVEALGAVRLRTGGK